MYSACFSNSLSQQRLFTFVKNVVSLSGRFDSIMMASYDRFSGGKLGDRMVKVCGCLCRAFATLAYDPGALMLDAMASQISDKVLQFRPQVTFKSDPKRRAA